MNKLLFSTAAAVFLTALSTGWLDLRLAGFIFDQTGMSFQFSHAISSLPDALLLTVIAVSLFSWTGYFLLSRKSISDSRTLLFQVLGTSLPFAYAAKDLLKWIFGRMDTRFWLVHPEAYSFHWFHGGQNYDGFPSGHMLVFTPLFLALRKFSPKAGPLIFTGWLGLAASLLVTEYHFLGDVIAGSYAGFLIHCGTDRYFRRRP